MAQKLAWNDTKDDWLRALRSRGHSWQAIGTALAISRSAVMVRAQDLDVWVPRMHAARVAADYAARAARDPCRPPLRAGHPVAWGLLTHGTLLDGVAYPRQPPMGRIPRQVIGELC